MLGPVGRRAVPLEAPISPYCARYHRAMSVVANRWTLDIVRALLAGARRFGEISAAIPGLSDRLLSERLKTLEAEGIVSRIVLPETPVRVEYHLTERGTELAEPVAALAAWAERWIPLAEADAAALRSQGSSETPQPL